MMRFFNAGLTKGFSEPTIIMDARVKPGHDNKMNLRRLGQSDLHIAPLMLGGNVFGWNVDEATSFIILDAFVDAGFNAIDTANTYSRWVPGHQGGESESIIGKWLKAGGKRDRVVIATKVGEDMGRGRGLKTADILREAENSLRRLQTDRIDLYQTHFDDPNTAPEETLQAYAQLIAQGKVRAIGASNIAPARLQASQDTSQRLGLARYESLQPRYNLHDREKFEREVEPICLKERIGVIPYYSLAAGFLTGKYRSQSDIGKSAARAPRIKDFLNERGLRILRALDEVAARHGATPAQVSLAWLIARPSVTAPIASATNLTQLHEIMQAPRLTLTAEDMTALNEASA
jgi:aryl-alcohol dehydrogenase-like predicted oxidoreductase